MERREELERKKLRDRMIDLRMLLYRAGELANTIKGDLPLKWALPCKFGYRITQSDDEICEIAKEMDLDKIDVIKTGGQDDSAKQAIR